MAVARSYENLEQVGNPFEENKRMYVYVVMKSGNQKKVRWYTDAERAAQDRKAGIEVKKNDLMDFNARHAFGFDELGYITIYKATNQHVLEEYVDSHHESFRFNLTFRFYTPSRIPVPDLPDGVEAIRLNWEEVQDYEDRMRPHEVIEKYINGLLGEKSSTSSICQGEIGTWIERDLAVSDNHAIENHFGEKHIHTMIDDNGNVYKWETGTKNYEVGKSMRLNMKVKEHTDDGITIVWYCKEV